LHPLARLLLKPQLPDLQLDEEVHWFLLQLLHILLLMLRQSSSDLPTPTVFLGFWLFNSL
jgi:hypothetical protein